MSTRNNRSMKEILARHLTRPRLTLNSKLNAARHPEAGQPFTLDEFKQFARNLAGMEGHLRDKSDSFMAHEVERAINAVETGVVEKRPNTKTPDAQLLWGAALGFLSVNPDIMKAWSNNPVEDGNVKQSDVWKKVSTTASVTRELREHADNADSTLKYRGMRFKWVTPEEGFAYNRKTNVAAFDMVSGLIGGLEHARADGLRKLNEVKYTRSYPDRMADLAEQIKPLERKMRAIQDYEQAKREGKKVKKLPPETKMTPEDYKQLHMLTSEFSLRHMLFSAAEANTVNRAVFNRGLRDQQDYGASLNNISLTKNATGLERLPEGDEISQDLKTYLNLVQSVKMSVYQNTEFFGNSNADWENVGIKPDWVRKTSTRKKSGLGDGKGVAHKDFTDLRELCGGEGGLEKLMEKQGQRIVGAEFQDQEMRQLSQKRNAVIERIFNEYAEDLLENILKLEEEKIDQALEEAQEQQQQQQDQDQQQQDQNQDQQDGDSSDQNQDGSPQPSDGDGKPDPNAKPQKGGQSGDPSSEQSKPQKSDDQQDQSEGDQQQNKQQQKPQPQDDQGDQSQGGGDEQQQDQAAKDQQQEQQQSGGGDENEQDQNSAQDQQDAANDNAGGQDENAPEQDADGQDAAADDNTVPVEDSGDMPAIDTPALSPEEEQGTEPSQDADGKDADGQDADGQDADGKDAESMAEDQKNAEDAEAAEANEQDGDSNDADGDDADGQDADGQDADGDDADAKSFEELAQEAQDAQAQEDAEAQAEAEAKAKAEQGQDGQDGQDSQKSDAEGKAKQKESKNSKGGKDKKGRTPLDEVATRGWSDLSRRRAELTPHINQIKEIFLELQRLQTEFKHQKTDVTDLRPEDADLKEGLHRGKHFDKIIKEMTGQHITKEDREVWRQERPKKEPTTIDLFIFVDGSGSMGKGQKNAPPGTKPSALETALLIGYLLYEGTNHPDLNFNVFFGLWGNEDPVMLLEPGATDKEVAEKLELARTGGLNCGTNLAPGLKKIASVIGNHDYKVGMVGHTHAVIISDGDIFDKEPSAQMTKALFRSCDTITLDTVILKGSYNNNPAALTDMEKWAKDVKGKGPKQKVGSVRALDPKTAPKEVMRLLLQRMKKCGSFIAVPKTQKQEQMKIAKRRMSLKK